MQTSTETTRIRIAEPLQTLLNELRTENEGPMVHKANQKLDIDGHYNDERSMVR